MSTDDVHTATPARTGSRLRRSVSSAFAALESRRMLDLSIVLIAGSALVLTVTGLVTVLSASSIEGVGSIANPFSLFLRQAVWAVSGLALMVVLAMVPVRWLKRLALPAILLAIALLALVAFTPLGVSVGGNRNWIRIAGFQAQPSEAAKLALALWGGWVLGRKGRLVSQVSHAIVPVIFPVGVVILGLIMWGRDLGTALIILIILGAMLFVAGTHRMVFMVSAAIGVIGVVGLSLTAAHRLARVQAWTLIRRDNEVCTRFDFDPCFQPDHGLYALASGGWWGLGPGQSRQKWSYIPEAENDFIFTILGEEMGLLGTTFVILLFAALAIGMYRVAAQTSSTFIRVTTWGIIAWFIGQAFLNIAMVSGLLPVVGVPLPFISYGGSALTLSLAAVGVVLAFARHERAVARQAARAPVTVVASAPVPARAAAPAPARR
ncbi:MAG: putative lipid II flippase FtsW [Micrococcus sp.]|nr:putative lipid II flippase FtsW [Micrococcus sp.]